MILLSVQAVFVFRKWIVLSNCIFTLLKRLIIFYDLESRHTIFINVYFAEIVGELLEQETMQGRAGR